MKGMGDDKEPVAAADHDKPADEVENHAGHEYDDTEEVQDGVKSTEWEDDNLWCFGIRIGCWSVPFVAKKVFNRTPPIRKSAKSVISSSLRWQ